MTAKIVSILLALLTLISGTAAASFDPETDLQTQHGYILEKHDAWLRGEPENIVVKGCL